MYFFKTKLEAASVEERTYGYTKKGRRTPFYSIRTKQHNAVLVINHLD